MRRQHRVLAATVLGVMAGVLPAVASAHPLGNFSINHYAAIRVAEPSIEVDLVIDMAEIPALDAIAEIDTNQSGVADPSELDAARGPRCERLVDQVALTVAGSTTGLEVFAAGLHVTPGAGGLVTLRTVCELRAPLATAIGPGTELTFTDGSYSERIGWREIVVMGDGVTVVGDDATLDVSERLTRYPDDLLRQPLNERVAALSLNPGGPDLEPWSATDAWPVDRSGAARTDTAIPGGVSGELPAIIDLRNLSLPVAGLGLLLAVIAGAGHAVSPGHGKTVMAAYLLGSRGGTRQAILLGGLVTISHTVGVLLLAVVVLVAGEVLPPERLYPVLTLVSGTTVVLIGAALLIGCIRRLRSPVGRTHAHGDGAHRHGLRVHTHGHSSNPSWRGLAALGIAGGLVPSTSALILLLAAVGAGQPTYGLALAVAFGIGMATVLTGIGLALVHGRTVVGRLGSDRPRLALAGAAIPWLTAVMVIGGGVVLTGQALIVSL